MNPKTISLLALAIAIAGLCVLINKHYIISSNPVAISVQLCAALLMIWARISFGLRSFHGAANATQGNLVTNGPYRWMRNPIYTAIIIFSFGCVIAYPYLITLALAILISVCMITRALMEEKYLSVTYPDYAAYAKRTKRFIPFII
jgi:protein-S-isoprenylcysteine O-methyltransferase Ste14